MRDRKGAVSEICRLMEEEVQTLLLDKLYDFENVGELVDCLQGKSKHDFAKFFVAGDLVFGGSVVPEKIRGWVRDRYKIQMSIQGLYLQEELLLLWDILEMTKGGMPIDKGGFQKAVSLVVKVRNVGGESHVKKLLEYDVSNDVLWIDFCNSVLEIESVFQCPELRNLVNKHSIKLSTIPGNLPAPYYEHQGSGRFYGRFEELSKLKKKIRTKRSRGVEITGRGGLGKTALAIKLVHELSPADFTNVVWFSAKTDLMTAAGVEDLRFSHHGLHSILSAIAIVLINDGLEDDFGPGLWGLNELYSAVSQELEKVESNVLIVVDNWETIETIFGSSGYQRLRGAIEDEAHEYFLDATWLITSRVSTGLDGMSEVPLPKMDENSAHSMLKDHSRHSDRMPDSLKSWFNKKENRQRAVDYCDCYPLFMRIFCGWLENGMELDQALNRRSDERYELEEFCFRRSLDSLSYSYSLWVIYFLDKCSECGVRNLRYHDVQDALSLTHEEWLVAKRELLDFCIIIESEDGLVVAPAMSGFVRRNVQIADSDFRVRCSEAVESLKQKRTVREGRYGSSWRKGMLPLLQSALGVMAAGQKRPESFSLALSNLADSPYKTQLNLLSHLLDGKGLEEEWSNYDFSAFDFHGGYYGIIEVIMAELRSKKVDTDGRFSLAFSEVLKAEFFDCNPWYYTYMLNRIHVAIHDSADPRILECILREVVNRSSHLYCNFLQTAWKKIFHARVEMNEGLIEVCGLDLVEMSKTRRRWDLEWSKGLDKFIPDSARSIWVDWLDRCAEMEYGDAAGFYSLIQNGR